MTCSEWIVSHKFTILLLAALTATLVAITVVAVDRKKLQDQVSRHKGHIDFLDDVIPDYTTDYTTTPEDLENLERWRLPETVIPEFYDLYLFPNLNKGSFRGNATIAIKVKEPVAEIRLHSNGLQIEHVKIDGAKAIHELDEEYELLVVTAEDGGIAAGNTILEIQYRGSMTNKIVGLYSSSYINENNEKRTIATTKFQPTYARQAFPCFDEPQLKATYRVHILKPKDYIALSNMPQDKITDHPDGHIVHFEKSVEMSTYLACFIVCDFKYTSSSFKNFQSAKEVPLRVFSTPGQVQKTNYPLEVAKSVMEHYLEYFQIKYPLPKLDLAAIPDYVSGATEHWGIITFREAGLLYDEKKTSVGQKQRIATVIAHELAHSWFGNLVTCEWWNDIWLNEGFANYIEFKGVNHHHPDWLMLDQFLIEVLHPVLAKDATPASYPIIQSTTTPNQITALFNFIAYGKGASVLRMLEGAMTERKFRNGLTAYLRAFSWGNAKTQDLWDILQEHSVLNVTRFMDTWTYQQGYPILTVREEGDKYVLTQERFLISSGHDDSARSAFGYKWTIPVTYITDKDQENPKLYWLHYPNDYMSIHKPAEASWIKFNHKQTGLYRVNYPTEMWKKLASNIHTFQSVSDRTHLLEEAFSIASSGLIHYDIPLSLTKYLEKEDNYIPWTVGVSELKSLRKYLEYSLEYNSYLVYCRKLVKTLFNTLTWDEKPDDGHLDKRLRILIIDFACSMESKECKKEAKKRFKEWTNDPTTELPQNIRSIIYKYGVKESEKSWHDLFAIFRKERDAAEKLNLLLGLASAKEPRLLKRLLELAKNEEIVRSQDYFTMLRYISSNPIGSSIVWDYVRENWPYLVERFGLNDRYFGGMIPDITAGFTTRTKLKEMEVFFETYPDAGAGATARKMALAQVRNNIRWIDQNKKTVEKWIKANVRTKTNKPE